MKTRLSLRKIEARPNLSSDAPEASYFTAVKEDRELLNEVSAQ